MSSLTSAWQAALAACHAAVFGYGRLGPWLPNGQQQLARSCGNEQRSVRDATQASISAAGLTPVPPLAEYPHTDVSDAGQARALALRIEQDCAQAWRYLYACAAEPAAPETRTREQAPVPPAQLREAAQHGLTGSAVRAARWRSLVDPQHATEPFPGI